MNVSSTNKQRKYLIAIGSPSCSEMGLPRLDGVETDIQRVEKLLINEEQGYTKALPGLYVGAASDVIRNTLTSWFTSQDRRNSDCVIIYYAGHAGEEIENHSHYLYTVESNPSNLPNTAIETSDLVKYLFPGKQNSPQHILLILDVCYAGQGAANVLVSSLTQKGNATENISFCVIASADSKTEAGDGDFVDAFEKVMKDSDWMKSRGEFLPICDLVPHINKFLGEKCKVDNKGIQEASWSILPNSREITFFCNPRFLKKNRTKTKCDKQEIADLLWLLDYSAQEQNFRIVMKHQSEGAFLIQAKEERIQRWLVRRLAGYVPDFEKAQKFSIRIPNHPMRSNFVEFWSEFKQVCVGNPSCESVIKSLAKLCREKSVIIVMYGLRFLEQAEITQLHNFWLRLMEEVRSIPQIERNFRSKVILLMAEGNSTTLRDKLRPFELVNPAVFNENRYHISISLTPLEKISQSDAKTWLEQEQVYSSLNCQEEEIQAIVCNDINKWDEEPSQMLEEICQTVFKVPDGIAAIEPYWKLLG